MEGMTQIFWTTIGSIAVLTVAAFFKLVFQILDMKSYLERIDDTTNNTNKQVIQINTKLD